MLFTLANTVNSKQKVNYNRINPKIKPASGRQFSDKAVYGVLLFGKKANKAIWLIADFKSKQSKTFDVLYIDKNANGIIGEAGERTDRDVTLFGGAYEINDCKNPATGETTKILAFVKATKNNQAEIQLHLKVNEYMSYAFLNTGSSPENAGKLYIGFEQALNFYKGDVALKNYEFYEGMGELKNAPYKDYYLNKIAYNIGRKGTNGSKWFVDISFVPQNESLIASLKYIDKRGKNKEYISKLNMRC